MEVANINVKTREGRGTRYSAKLRATDQIPAVIYGRGKDNMTLSVPAQRFTQLVMTHHKLFELHFDSGTVEEAFLQDLQWDPLSDVILHADFKRIELSEKLQTEVEIHFVGQPKGLAKNGLFDTTLSRLRIECLPKDLPEEIKINVNDLDVGEAIYVKDLPLPENVAALDDPELLVCQCMLRHGGMEAEEETTAEEGAAEPEVIGKEKKEDEGGGE